MHEMSSLNPWFSSIDEDERAKICDNVSFIKIKKGHVLFRRGELVDNVAMIRSGILWCERTSPEGRNHVQAVMGPGFFGHFAWPLVKSLANYDVKAVIDAEVFVIPGAIIRYLMDNSKSFAARYTGLMIRSHEMLEEYTFVMSVYYKVQKVAWILSIIADGYRGLSRPIMNIPITQVQLADNMGMTRQTINKSLQSLSDSGIINVSKSNINILDLGRLKNICHFDDHVC